jgi:hypothetical protein
LAAFAELETEAVVSGFENVAAVGKTVEQQGRHLGVAEYGGPLADAEISRDDDAGALVELAQQMEEQGPAGRGRALEISECATHSSILLRSETLGGRGLTKRLWDPPIPVSSRSRSEASLDRVSPWR